MKRDRVTWLSYLLLAFYGYFLNILGPITPYLKSELQLSYTVSSLHFSAFALGLIAAGLIGDRVVQRFGRAAALWASAFGISLASLVLIAGRHPALTISACFAMGLIGSLVLTVVPSLLADQHGEARAMALSEANVMASVLSTVAPMLVGWFALTAFGWRMAIVVAVLSVLVLRLAFGGLALPAAHDSAAGRRGLASLPRLYWIYWAAIVAAVSVEFCMIFWSADYLETGLGMARADAARAVSLFLAGMILGRLAGSRLGARVGARRVVTFSLLLAALGFAAYWLAPAPWLGLAGLFLTGLGVASLYPMLLSLAIGAAGSNTVQASAVSSLASGIAILALPLLLGRLADWAGIRPAYSVVIALLVIALLLIRLTARPAPRAAESAPAD